MNVSKVAKKGLLSTQTGTPYYASPEVWKDLPYNSTSDIWSLGCVLYEMICHKPPFLANDMEELYEKVCKGKYPDIPDTFSFELRRVLSLMLQVKPKRRPSTSEILNLKEVKDKIDELYVDEIPESKLGIRNSLMNTIMLPKEFMDLTKKLPKPNYSYDNSSFSPKYLNLEMAGKKF
jgi:NIMA (never in mitosis gene a)-related kinase